MKGTARKLLSIVLALVMAAGIIPAAPAQAEGTLPEAAAPAPDAPAQTASTHRISFVRVNVDRFVQTTPDPGTRPILKNNNVELEWDVVPPSNVVNVTATITDFYTNQSCTNRLTHQPISGDSYYTILRVYVNFGNYTNYVADASRFDKSNTRVYCDGYEGECVAKTHTTGAYGGVTIELTIKFTKGAEYSVRSFHVTGDHVGENNGAYTVLGGSTRIGWKDNKTPVANVYQLLNTSLCTNNYCDDRLTTKPKMGETYYIKFTFQNIDSGKHYIDYDSITASDVSLTVPGYNCSVFSVQSGVERVGDGGSQMQVYDKLDIIFAVELESQYSLVGISATGSGIGRDGAQHTVLNFNPTITWKNNNVPASSKYRVVKSILYTDPALTSVAGAPTAGGTYYFSVRVINNIAGDNSIYFGEVDTGSCTLTVPGYTITRYTSYETTDGGKNGYRIIFKMVNNSKITLRSVAITATGATSAGLDGMNHTLAWDNGTPVSSAYSVSQGGGVQGSRLFKDAACTQVAYSWDAGKPLYAKITVRNAKNDNHDLDFAKLQKSNCSLTIPDIAASCVSVNARSGTSSSYDVVEIVFKLTENPYVAASFKDNLKNVKSRWDDGYEWYINANSFYGEFTWKDGRVPTKAQGRIDFDVSYLYEDEDCTSLYRGEALVDGDSYYVKYTIRNDIFVTESVIDFSKLNATNCTLKLADSFDVEVVSVTTVTTASYWEGYDADEVYIIFRLTRKPTYVLEGFAAVSGGLVRELGGYYRLQVEGKVNYTLTWKDGKAPASDDNWGVYDRYIYTDFECETKLTTEPQDGENYFVKLSVENDVREDHSISFWELDRWSPLTLSLAGYECKLSNDPSYHVHPADDEHAWDRIYLIFRITKREQAIELLTEDGAPFTVGKVLRPEGMSRTAGGTGEPAGLGYDPDNISMTLRVSGASTPNDALTALNGATFERAARNAGGSIVFERLTGSISGNTMTLSHTSGGKTVPVMRIRAYVQGGVHIELTSLAPGAVRLTLEGREYLLATPGDVNLDGTMNALDWITIMRWTLVASGGEYTSPDDEGFTINVDDTQYNLWVLLADMTDTETDNSKNSANWGAAVNAVDWITIMQLTLQAWK